MFLCSRPPPKFGGRVNFGNSCVDYQLCRDLLQNASENGSVRFSYTNNDTKGMIPSSSMISHNFNLRGVMNLSDKLSIDAKATYFTQEVNGRQQMGGEGIMGVLYQMPRSVDINDLKKFQVDNPGTPDEFKVLNYGGSNSQTANPYWMATILHRQNLLIYFD